MYVYYIYVVKSTLANGWHVSFIQVQNTLYTFHNDYVLVENAHLQTNSLYHAWTLNKKQAKCVLPHFTFLFIIFPEVKNGRRTIYIVYIWILRFSECFYRFVFFFFSSKGNIRMNESPAVTTWKSFSHLLFFLARTFMETSKSIVTICLFYLWLNFCIENSIEGV